MNNKRFQAIKWIFLLLGAALALAFTAYHSLDTISVQAAPPARPLDAPQMRLLGATGRVTYLRVNDVGTGFGPDNDFLDVEVVIQLDSKPNNAMGFTLRDDKNRAAHTAMFNLIRDAYKNNWPITIDYNMEDGKNNGTIIRVNVRR